MKYLLTLLTLTLALQACNEQKNKEIRYARQSPAQPAEEKLDLTVTPPKPTAGQYRKDGYTQTPFSQNG